MLHSYSQNKLECFPRQAFKSWYYIFKYKWRILNYMGINLATHPVELCMLPSYLQNMLECFPKQE